jgi:hypothetical protein
MYEVKCHRETLAWRFHLEDFSSSTLGGTQKRNAYEIYGRKNHLGNLGEDNFKKRFEISRM